MVIGDGGLGNWIGERLLRGPMVDCRWWPWSSRGVESRGESSRLGDGAGAGSAHSDRFGDWRGEASMLCVGAGAGSAQSVRFGDWWGGGSRCGEVGRGVGVGVVEGCCRLQNLRRRIRRSCAICCSRRRRGDIVGGSGCGEVVVCVVVGALEVGLLLSVLVVVGGVILVLEVGGLEVGLVVGGGGR